jgi:hypothetical protein
MSCLIAVLMMKINPESENRSHILLNPIAVVLLSAMSLFRQFVSIQKCFVSLYAIAFTAQMQHAHLYANFILT